MNGTRRGSAWKVLIIGHRGCARCAPENTLAGIRAASGASDMVEFDVRVSADGRLVAIHDETLERTTSGVGPVHARTLADLRRLDAGAWFGPAFAGERIPTLSEAMDAAGRRATALIERKAGGADLFVRELAVPGFDRQAALQSFDWGFLGEVRALAPGIRRVALGEERLTRAVLTRLMSDGIGAIAWSARVLGRAGVEMAHEARMAVYVWTVNGPEIRGFLDLGVDGVITDDPAAARRMLRQRGPDAGLDRGIGS